MARKAKSPSTPPSGSPGMPMPNMPKGMGGKQMPQNMPRRGRR